VPCEKSALVPAVPASAKSPKPPELAPMDLRAPPPIAKWSDHGFSCDSLTLDTVAEGERERDDAFVIPAFAQAFERWRAARQQLFEGRGYRYSFALSGVRHCNNCEAGIAHERIENGAECAQGDLSFQVYSNSCVLEQSEVAFSKDCCEGVCPARSPEVWMIRFLTARSQEDRARLAPLFAPAPGTEIDISGGDEDVEPFYIASSDDMQTAPVMQLDSPLESILAGYTQLSCAEEFEGDEWECSTTSGGYWVTYYWRGDARHAVLVRVEEVGE
jgi:hypothetical protein